MVQNLRWYTRREDRRRLQLEALEKRRLLAVSAHLLADLNALGGSDPQEFVEVGSIAFFTANDGTNGRELWKSDGTEAGTVLVKDIFPGATGSSPFALTNVSGTLFFSANDSTTGEELWKSDGTLGGTVLVKDIFPGASSSSPRGLTNASGTLFFSANDGTTGLELWKSSGGAAADATTTSLVEDIFPGASSSFPGALTNVSGTLFFTANDGTTGNELWKSTGGAAADATTTSLVEDINPGAASSNPSGNLTNVSGTLFFEANDGTNGRELWKSTGGAAADATTTSLVEDINPGVSNSSPSSLTNVSGTLFFAANDGTNGRELWKSTGGAAADATTTSLVENINPGGGGASSDPGYLTNVSGTLFFEADDGTHGNELWKSQGTALNTEIVRDINPNAASSDPSGLTNVSGKLYFGANDGTHGYELWKSDGTLKGTALVRDINLGSASSEPYFLANINGTLYFAANDATGAEPWIVFPMIHSKSKSNTCRFPVNHGFNDSNPNWNHCNSNSHGKPTWTRAKPNGHTICHAPKVVYKRPVSCKSPVMTYKPPSVKTSWQQISKSKTSDAAHDLVFHAIGVKKATTDALNVMKSAKVLGSFRWRR